MVTGSSRGIGRAVLRALSRRQRALIVTYRSDRQSADAAARELGSCAASTLVHQLDVRDPESVDTLMRVVAQRYGRLDVLVNNAGITADRTVAKMSDQQWRDVLDVNLSGAFYCSRAAIPLMVRAGGGRIINITSVMGEIASHGQANYSASKAGLIGFTRTLAVELAPKNITVNAVSPGFIVTDLLNRLLPASSQAEIAKTIPMRRFGTPEDVAEAVAFLANGASYITGSVIHVNGGIHG